MWYLFIISVLLILFSINTSTNVTFRWKKNTGVISIDQLKFIIVFLILLFLTMFRGDTIGNDTKTYMNYFQIISDIGVSKTINFEFGYQFFNVLVSNISKDPRAIIIATSLLSYFLFGMYYFKKCENPLLAIVMFYALFFSMFTNVIRMACSISFLLWAYDAMEKRKIFRTIIFTSIAILFHSTSIVFVPFLIIIFYNIKLSKKLFGLFSFILTFLCLASDYMLIIISKFVEIFGGRFANSSYLLSDRTETGALGVTLSIIILGVIYYCYSKLVEKHDQKESTNWLFAFSLVFYLLSLVMNLFDRLANIFLFLLIVPTINEIIKSKKPNKKLYIISLIIILLCVFLFKIVVRPEWNNLYPYEFMFH